MRLAILSGPQFLLKWTVWFLPGFPSGHPDALLAALLFHRMLSAFVHTTILRIIGDSGIHTVTMCFGIFVLL